jgi:probable phosphoglycerate mutase
MTQIFLIRHVETVWNAENRMQGHLDSPLTHTGLAQAEALAEYFKSQRFAAFYSSDLGRAYETMRHISEKNGLSFSTMPCLRERNFGILQGVLKKELTVKFPEVYRRYKTYEPDYVIPEGESIKQSSERCIKCLEELAKKHLDKRILIVTHSGVLVSIFKHTMDIPIEIRPRFNSSNSCINVFSFQDGIWTLERLGDLSHLHQ